MKLLTLITPFSLLFISLHAAAQCELDTTTELGGVSPTTLNIGQMRIAIDADAPVDTVNPIIRLESNPQQGKISYVNCVPGENYGKSVTELLSTMLSDKMFASNIDGLAIKPKWNNGEAEGSFPSVSVLNEARMNYPSGSFFAIEIYKTKPTLSLTNTAGDLLHPGGIVAYNWVNAAIPSNYAQRLNLGALSIISTPVCQIEGDKMVDFNIVTAGDLGGGVIRPLNFTLNCATDYNTYSASATLSAQEITEDFKAIKVKDSQGNLDRLKIMISDSNGTPMDTNGTSLEKRQNIASNTPVEFNWTATLMPTSTTKFPANGQFTATAEIILQIN
ncbi:fimbrial protein [Enterobacteriaceae bacterium 4M9]|nr:fimbrial protein [Enterobacteriaceae bacterium 4M9]